MAFSYDSAIAYRTPWQPGHYDARDVAIYTLGVGLGHDPMDERALDFLLETRGPRVLPSLATTLARSITRDLGLDMTGVVHAAQRTDIPAPLPPEATFVWQAAVSAIIDKGPGKGAIVAFDTTARLAEDGPELFVLRNTLLARRDGGCGGPSVPSAVRNTVPARAVDHVHETRTRPEQALLFRLNGDLNPLHAEPAAARTAGFRRPILHGLCTYGIACRALVETLCGFNPARMRRFEGRFSAPVYPGDTIATEIWSDNDGARFRCRVPARDVTVMDDGVCILAPQAESLAPHV